MPSKPKKPCAFPGCPKVTINRYCPEHEKKVNQDYEAKRETAVARGYTHRWSKVRTMKLNADPLCERCIRQKRDEAATRVHHKDRDPKNNAWWNLESLCKPCHEAEHKGERWGGH